MKMEFPFNDEIVLENAGVLLRPIKIQDVENLLTVAIADKDLLQYSPAPVYTKELLNQYLNKAIDDRQNNTRYAFSIFDKTKNAYAGSSSFMNISNADSRLEIGSTWFGKMFQKTGLNRNCKYLMLSFAFDNHYASRVEFRTDERNITSRKAIEKIGGQFEGMLRSHTLMCDGFRRNTACYSILKNEWLTLKPVFLDHR